MAADSVEMVSSVKEHKNANVPAFMWTHFTWASSGIEDTAEDKKLLPEII